MPLQKDGKKVADDAWWEGQSKGTLGSEHTAKSCFDEHEGIGSEFGKDDRRRKKKRALIAMSQRSSIISTSAYYSSPKFQTCRMLVQKTTRIRFLEKSHSDRDRPYG